MLIKLCLKCKTLFTDQVCPGTNLAVKSKLNLYVLGKYTLLTGKKKKKKERERERERKKKLNKVKYKYTFVLEV